MTTETCHCGNPRCDAPARKRLEEAAPDLLAAAECEEALDLPWEEGRPILESHGWSYDQRFELPASEFVMKMRRAAIAKARGEAPDAA